ncbi:MAG: hypothetical protein WC943_15995, partial [Elusimicrobiota bacterium]
MTRAFLALAVVVSLLSWAPPLAAQQKSKPKPTAVVSIPFSSDLVADILWNDAKHEAFFKYQAYLEAVVAKNGLPANVFSYDTEPTWKALAKEERIKRVAAGEEYLRKTLEDFLATGQVTQAQADMITNVWGKDVMKDISVMMTAKSFGNPGQVKAAQEELAKLNGKL